MSDALQSAPKQNAGDTSKAEEKADTDQELSSLAAPPVIQVKAEVIQQESQQSAHGGPWYEPVFEPDWWLVVFTLGLMIYTAKLFRETRRLAVDAKATGTQQAKDTAEALAISRESALAAKTSADATKDLVTSERAWVVAQGPSISWSSNTTIGGVLYPYVPNIHIVWTNAGRTPAINAQAYIDCRILPVGSPLPDLGVAWPDGQPTTVIGPNCPFMSREVGFGGPQLAQVLETELSIFVFSAVRYTDIFDETNFHESKVGYEIVRNGSQVTADGKELPRFQVRPSGIASAE